MIELNKLTRTFHDQTIDNVEIKGKNLFVTLGVYELGKEYGYTAESEEADLSDQDEHYRKIFITFYNIKNINKDFKYQFDNLDIYETTIEGTKFTFWSYFESDDPNYLFFDTDGFDFEYIASEMNNTFILSRQSLDFIKKNVLNQLEINLITEENIDDICEYVGNTFENGNLDKNGEPIKGKEQELEIATNIVTEISGNLSKGLKPDCDSMNMRLGLK